MSISRRSFVSLVASAPLLRPQRGKIPVGLELYSVREELAKDLNGTVTAVAKMGYQGVEFFSPYYNWTPDKAREVRKLLDDLGIRCFSTHNDAKSFTPEGVGHASELNQILGSKFIVLASAGRVKGLEGWKDVADRLNRTAEAVKAAGLRVGYHNHQAEFTPIEGRRPMEVLAASTTKNVMLQLDVGTCVEMGSDPVAWIDQNPGRINSLHCKDWAPGPDKGYRVLLGEGVAPWRKIFQAAEKTGGVEYYLVEQEGSAYSPMETAQRCLAAFKKLHG